MTFAYDIAAKAKQEDNAKFTEIAKLLGFETEYFSGMFRVRLNGHFLGQMSAEAWIDHLRTCMAKTRRS